MALPNPVSFRIPSTSANLGPGFDLFGLALDQYTYFDVEYKKGDYRITDPQGEEFAIPPDKNFIRLAYLYALSQRGLDKDAPALHVQTKFDLPSGRGFGSSASALVAGVAAANHLLRSRGERDFTLNEEIAFLNELEGHPDNVTPARIGGWVFCSMQNGVPLFIRKKIPASLGLSVLVPDYQISTRSSRTRLPEKYSRETLLSNMQGALLWLAYVDSGDPELLKVAVHSDKIHEPYRTPSIKGFKELREAILSIGCYGATISGSGPGILIYFSKEDSSRILPKLNSIIKTLEEKNLSPGELRVCNMDDTGLKIEKS